MTVWKKSLLNKQYYARTPKKGIVYIWASIVTDLII